MIAAIVAGLARIPARAWLAVGGLALLIAAVFWLRADARSDLIEQQQARAVKAERRADQRAAARDTQIVRNDEDLRHAAEQGDDSRVGAGVRAVVERVRDQQDRAAR